MFEPKELLEKIEQVRGWLSREEATLLGYYAEQVEKLDGFIVEVGSYCGKSTIILSSVEKEKNKKIISVDPFLWDGGTFNEFTNNLKMFNLYDSVIPIACEAENLKYIWNKKIKLLFLDGEHDYESNKDIFNSLEPFIVENGIILFHDSLHNDNDYELYKTKEETNHPIEGGIGWVGPTKALNEIRKNKEKYIDIEKNVGCLNGIKKIKL